MVFSESGSEIFERELSLGLRVFIEFVILRFPIANCFNFKSFWNIINSFKLAGVLLVFCTNRIFVAFSESGREIFEWEVTCKLRDVA